MRWRFRAGLLFFIIAFFLVSGKLFYWQIVKADELSRLGRNQYSQQQLIMPQRGDIKTSDGFPIATTKLSYLVFANPKEIGDRQGVSDKLSSLLDLDSATISAILSTPDRYWMGIKSNLTDDTKKHIDALKIKGVGFEEQYKRFYTEASMAAHLIGFVGKDAYGNDKGYFGLEGYYDRQLQGRPGQAVLIHDARGFPVLSQFDETTGEKDGRNLILNIDRSIQYVVEQKLKAGIQEYGAESGMAAVMDPKTGAMLAMTAFPAFDPTHFFDFDPKTYKNPFITDTYEPGSTFKPLIMASGIDYGLITPTTQCPICDGPVAVGGYDIHTWNNEYFKNIDMIHVMIHSDNTGMVYISQKLGLDKMLETLKRFGIGDQTGIDLEGELAPGLKDPSEWHVIDVATTSFGQGISVTPIEILDAFASIANKGIRMQPHVVKKIITSDGEKFPIEPKVLDKTMSPESAKVMSEILVHAVNEGEAKFARLKGYRIAGKTGTASIPVNGHYDATKTIASFIGFAPADDPKFIALVILNKPTTSIYGAETAAPIFFDIARDILTYYGIAPKGDE